ncbi:hypothetical protein ABC733_18510 [Mangrovibacter sp. SLW1]
MSELLSRLSFAWPWAWLLLPLPFLTGLLARKTPNAGAQVRVPFCRNWWQNCNCLTRHEPPALEGCRVLACLVVGCLCAGPPGIPVASPTNH